MLAFLAQKKPPNKKTKHSEDGDQSKFERNFSITFNWRWSEGGGGGGGVEVWGLNRLIEDALFKSFFFKFFFVTPPTILFFSFASFLYSPALIRPKTPHLGVVFG